MRAVVIGSSGGVGSALAEALEMRGAAVTRLSRRDTGLDLEHPETIAAAARRLAGEGAVDLVLVATGALHWEGSGPERSLSRLDAGQLLRSFAVNAVGPAMVLQHFTPLLRRDGRAVVAVLSARVGSIADNRLGGWYGYRASKAALNQIVRTAAIELSRTRPQAICVALHPGTVDTQLSRPFQRGLPNGQLLAPTEAAAHLLTVIDGLAPSDSGGFFDWRGQPIPF